VSSRRGLHEVPEDVLPHALFLQASEEALASPVLLRCVVRDELLAQADRRNKESFQLKARLVKLGG
jgi:hypothetical protein